MSDGSRIKKLIGDRILVELEPEADTISGIDVKLYKPGGSEGKDSHVFRIGKVKALGPGVWNKRKKTYTPIDLEVGARVLFIKFAATHTGTAKSIQGSLGKDFAIINESDVLFEVSPDFDIGSVSQ